MTVRDWRDLTNYWAKHPPACELLEIQVGWKPDDSARTDAPPVTDGELDALETQIADAEGR